MSGGVDSSVAAALMKRRGYDVIGITMQIWQESQTDPRHSGCCSLGAVEDARRVARLLDIPYYVINFKDEFRNSVIQNFIDEYSAGRTPNPCVQCNRHLKFDELIRKMRELGCSRLVTGHYARVRRRHSGRLELWRARGIEKDQSYVLYMLNQDQLASTCFPLGELPNKLEVRRMASELGLPVANKPDSQEICFVSEAGGYREFLRKVKPDAFVEGNLVHSGGQVLKRHRGIADYTIGQRKGIGLTMPGGKPLYVLEVLPSENTVVVGEEESLFRTEVNLIDVVWGRHQPEDPPRRVKAKVRYNMEPQWAILYSEPAKLVFERPVRAVTPGQMAVAYDGVAIAAGGVIR